MTRILLYGDKSFKDGVNLLILNATIDLFCLQADLMNHFIFPEFMVIFLFIHNYVATIFRILIFTFINYCCFYVYCVNVHFHRKYIDVKFIEQNKMFINVKYDNVILFSYFSLI